jgi:hypothetical protein
MCAGSIAIFLKFTKGSINVFLCVNMCTGKVSYFLKIFKVMCKEFALCVNVCYNVYIN